MANKFLGEAGLAVLVDEIRKKAGSENKSLLDTMLENAAPFDFNGTEINQDNPPNYYKTVYAMQMLNIVLAEAVGQNLDETELSGLDLINKYLDMPVSEGYPETTYRVLLSDDITMLSIINVAFQLVRIYSNGRLEYRDNPGDQTWHVYNPVSEISADEVTAKFTDNISGQPSQSPLS